MKYLYLVFTAVIITTFFTNCAGNKYLQDTAPVNMGNAYIEQTPAGFDLYIPIKTIQKNNISLDSVYFRGRKASLAIHPQHSGMHYAQFISMKEDMQMSSDPKEEYGNKAPVKMDKIPFKLKKDEAVIEFTQDGKLKYYKIDGISERS